MTMKRFARPVILLVLLFAHATAGRRALAQGDALFPGSTVQGDIMRGEGVKYRGAGIYYLNSAKARSIDTDTEMRFNQYVYESLKEYNRQCALRSAGAAARDKANLDKIQRRFREAPTELDIADGNALNVLLVELADPRSAAGPRATIALPADAIRRIPLQHASAGGVLSVHRLTVGGGWPLALRYKALEVPRRRYQEAVAAVLGECREHKLTPESVEAVGEAVKELRSRSEETLKVANPDYQAEGRRFVATLDRSARALVRAAYVEDLLGEVDAYRGTTVGELTGLLRRYNLHFGPAEEPAERQLYITLYPILKAEADSLGMGTSPSSARVQPDRPTTPSDRPGRSDEADGPEQEARLRSRLFGSWKLVSSKVGSGEDRSAEGITTLRHFTPAQTAIVSYDKDGKVIAARGGVYTFKSSICEMIYKYARNQTILDGTPQLHNMRIGENRWSEGGRRDAGQTFEEVWVRIPSGTQAGRPRSPVDRTITGGATDRSGQVVDLQDKLFGSWKLVSANIGGAEVKVPEGETRIKHVTQSQFVMFKYENTGLVIKAIGGPYTLRGDTYEEILEYGLVPDSERVRGTTYRFKCRIEGNKWHHQAKRDDGQTSEEVWERIGDGLRPDRPSITLDRPEQNAVAALGWTAVRVEGGEAAPLPAYAGWSSRDGTLACTGSGDQWLRSEKLYRDFRLTLEFRVPAGGNSGVHLRCTDRLAGRGNGMEIQIMDEDDERVQGVPAKCRTGSIWSVVGPAKRATLGPGRWNTLDVTCRGDLTRVVVNGITTAEADASRRPELIDLPRSGYISLENIGGKARGVEYRSIRVEELD